MDCALIYITTSDRPEAIRIGKILVEERLAACVNVIDSMVSIYRWQGEMCEDAEAVLLAKTSRGRVDALVARVAALHSYECPCIVTLPIASGNPPFLNWILEQTHSRNEDHDIRTD